MVPNYNNQQSLTSNFRFEAFKKWNKMEIVRCKNDLAAG